MKSMKKWITAVLVAVMCFSIAAPAVSAAETNPKPSFPTEVENQAYAVLENWKADRDNVGKIQRYEEFPLNVPSHVSQEVLSSAEKTFAKYLEDAVRAGNDYEKGITGLHLVGIDESDGMKIYEAAQLLYHGSNIAIFAMIGVIGVTAAIVMIPVSAVLFPFLTTELALDQVVELGRDIV